MELQNGVLQIVFEEPAPTKFVVSPNAPVRQIWVSALSRSFKLAWTDEASTFALDGERSTTLIARLAQQYLVSRRPFSPRTLRVLRIDAVRIVGVGDRLAVRLDPRGPVADVYRQLLLQRHGLLLAGVHRRPGCAARIHSVAVAHHVFGQRDRVLDADAAVAERARAPC